MIKALWRYPEKKAPAVQEKELILKEGFGIEGDHHADGGDRQISLLTVAEKEWMSKQEIKGFCFKKYRENILLKNVELHNCKKGDFITCGDVVLELTESIKSCHPELCKLAEEGTCILAGSSRFGRVIKGGVICEGMQVDVKHCE